MTKDEFVNLIEEHSQSLFSTACRLTGNYNDAEDLVQHTYLRAYKAFSSLKSDSNLKAWLFKILVNNFINHYRYNNRRPNHISSEDCELENWDPIDIPDVVEQVSESNLYDLEFAEDDIKRSVESIPESFRTVFLLNALEDMSYKEISDIVNCPVGTVMSRLHRARIMIRERLEQMQSVVLKNPVIKNAFSLSKERLHRSAAAVA